MPQAIGAFFASYFGAAVSVKAGVVTFGSAFATSFAAGVAFTTGYLIGAAAISVGLGKVMSALGPKLNMDMGGRVDMTLDPHPPRRIIYGRIKASGPIAFQETTSANNRFDEMLVYEVVFASHQIYEYETIWLNDQEVTLSTDSNDVFGAADSVFPNAEPNGVTRYKPADTDYVDSYMLKLYNGSQTLADSEIVSKTSRQATDVGNGIAYIAGFALMDPEAFASGQPKIAAIVKGKAVYDPRTATSDWSENPALCLADWWITPSEQGGAGKGTAADIDWDSISAAANLCDETVEEWDGGPSEPRYRCGVMILATTEHATVLRGFLSVMGSGASWEMVNGKWRLRVGAYRDPYLTLTEGNWIEPLQVRLNDSIRDSYNAIRPVLVSDDSDFNISSIAVVTGEFIDDISGIDAGENTINQPSNAYEDGDRVRFDVWTGSGFDSSLLPSGMLPRVLYYVVNAGETTFQIASTESGTPIDFGTLSSGSLTCFFDQYLTEDGVRRIRDSEYPFCPYPTQARRLAFTELKRMRQQIHMTATCDPTAFELEVGDTVRVIDSLRGFYAATGTPVSVAAASGVFTGATYAAGAPVMFTDPPAEIDPARVYYVINPVANTFQVSFFPGVNQPVTVTNGTYEVRPVIGKLFFVEDWNFGGMGDGVLGCHLVLSACDDDDWDHNSGKLTRPDVGESVTPFDFRSVPALTNLAIASGTAQLVIGQDGTIVTRARLTWDATTNRLVFNGGRVEVQLKESADLVWLPAGYTDGSVTLTFISNLKDGVEYDFRIRAVNSLGFFSAWTTQTNHEVVGKTAPPAAPVLDSATIDSGSTAILEWTDPTDLDLAYIEIWEDGAPIDFVLKGAEVYQYPIPPQESAHTYSFKLVAVDTTGNRSADSNVITAAAVVIPAVVVTGYPSNTLTTFRVEWTSALTTDLVEFSYQIGDVVQGVVVDDSGETDLPFPQPLTGSVTMVIVSARRLRRLSGGREYRTTPAVSGELEFAADPPSPPTGFSANFASESVLLAWTSPAFSAATQHPYRSIEIDVSQDNVNWNRVTGVDPLATGYVNSQRRAASVATLYYRIRTVDSGGNSSSYATDSVTIPAIENPAAITPVAETGRVRLNWLNVPYATAYIIQRQKVRDEFGNTDTGTMATIDTVSGGTLQWWDLQMDGNYYRYQIRSVVNGVEAASWRIDSVVNGTRFITPAADFPATPTVEAWVRDFGNSFITPPNNIGFPSAIPARFPHTKVPVFFRATAGNALPSGLTANTIYWVQITSGGTSMDVFTDEECTTAASFTASATGTPIAVSALVRTAWTTPSNLDQAYNHSTSQASNTYSGLPTFLVFDLKDREQFAFGCINVVGVLNMVYRHYDGLNGFRSQRIFVDEV